MNNFGIQFNCKVEGKKQTFTMSKHELGEQWIRDTFYDEIGHYGVYNMCYTKEILENFLVFLLDNLDDYVGGSFTLITSRETIKKQIIDYLYDCGYTMVDEFPEDED